VGVGALTRRAVFLDRDGVINHDWFNSKTGEWESPIDPADVRLIDGVPEALTALQAGGFRLYVVSNQPSAAKGKCSLADLAAVSEAIFQPLRAAGIGFTDIFYAYKHPSGVVPALTGPSRERKPGSYFLDTAITDGGLDPGACWMVGDRATDIECGQRAGVRTIRIQRSEDRPTDGPAPDDFALDLAAAAAIILAADPS
jgi:D-glycero-D-manno-heptose 1,7-bisphosphate phosphatase